MSHADPQPHRGLRGLVLRGVGRTMGTQVSIQVLGFATSIVIARLLVSHEVGVANEAVVFGTLALVLGDFGVASVLVQRPVLSEADTRCEPARPPMFSFRLSREWTIPEDRPGVAARAA